MPFKADDIQLLINQGQGLQGLQGQWNTNAFQGLGVGDQGQGFNRGGDGAGVANSGVNWMARGGPGNLNVPAAEVKGFDADTGISDATNKPHVDQGGEVADDGGGVAGKPEAPQADGGGAADEPVAPKADADVQEPHVSQHIQEQHWAMNRAIEQYFQAWRAGDGYSMTEALQTVQLLGKVDGDPNQWPSITAAGGMDKLLSNLRAAPGQPDAYDPNDYPWAEWAGSPYGLATNPTDVDMSSPMDTLANVPSYGEISPFMPPHLTMQSDDWWDVMQLGMITDWVENQRKSAGQDRAANIAAQELEQARGVAATPVMSDADMSRIMGGYAGGLADAEGRTMEAVRENMGARGLSPSSGVGAAMAGQASMQRQLGLGSARNQLATQQLGMNREGLERGLGLQSSAASNMENVLQGYGSAQWNVPSADYVRTLSDPGWADTGDDTSWKDDLMDMGESFQM